MTLDKIKNMIIFFIGFLISTIIIVYLVNSFNYSTFNSIISKVNFAKIFLAMLLLVFSVYIRAIRWQLLIKNGSSVNFLYKAELVGYFGNNIFPLRMGEFLRTYFVSVEYNLSKSKIFGTILLERILDMLGVSMLLFLLVFINYSFLFKINILLLFAIFGISLVGIIGTYFSFRRKKTTYKIKKNKFILIINEIHKGFSNLNNENIFKIFITTISIWFIYLLQLYLVQDSFNLGLNFSEIVILLVISTVAISIPALPGNFGTFEGAVFYSLSLFNIQDNFGFGFILHAVSFIPYTILGFLHFLKNLDIFKNFSYKLFSSNE